MTPPQEAPLGKKSIVDPTGRPSQRSASSASNDTSAGISTIDAVDPDRTVRRSTSSDCRNQSVLPHRGVSVAFQQSCDINGVSCETRTRCGVRNSRQDKRSEKPNHRQDADDFDERKARLLVLRRHQRDALRIVVCESPVSVSPEGVDLIGRVIPGNLVEIRMTPRVQRNGARSQVGAVPSGRGRWALN